ncbi:hypothetical protein EB796_008192 [Bugula neritina]|uniref:Uncharacterized protein n=1 Tax=Bugula neritina TaxID=10212 RepID=A0A7J7K4E3_BUGNE|nr:hypothetical protein EB796_008192 [Bugula neritina]
MPTYQTAVERVPFYPSSDSVQHIKSVNRVVLSVGAVAVSSGLQCYVCSTADDSTCDDLYGKPAGHLQDCLSDSLLDDGCSKAKSIGKVLGLKASTILRTCGGIYDNTHSPCHSAKDKDQILTIETEMMYMMSIECILLSFFY